MNPPTAVPTPVRNTPDGVYFVSSAPEGQPNSSGYAYYANLKDGGNDNEQPDAFAIADTFHQPHGEAEGGTLTPINAYTAPLCISFPPSNASDDSHIPRRHPLRVVYSIRRLSGQWQ